MNDYYTGLTMFCNSSNIQPTLLSCHLLLSNGNNILEDVDHNLNDTLIVLTV